MIGGEGRIIQAPVLEVIVLGLVVPLPCGEIHCDLHPVPLRLKVPVHWGGAHSCKREVGVIQVPVSTRHELNWQMASGRGKEVE